MAGYSGTPLPRKLGIRAGDTVVALDAPAGFEETLGELPEDVRLARDRRPAQMVIAFATSSHEMSLLFEEGMGLIPADGAIWVAWPKRSSRVETDLTEDVMRELFLPTGMVDTKVCAIDETWSGLRFVVRKENRPEWPR